MCVHSLWVFLSTGDLNQARFHAQACKKRLFAVPGKQFEPENKHTYQLILTPTPIKKSSLILAALFLLDMFFSEKSIKCHHFVHKKFTAEYGQLKV